MHFKQTAPVLGSLALASLVTAAPMEKRGSISYGDRTDHIKAYQDSQPAASSGYPAASSSTGSWGYGSSSAASNGYYAPTSTSASWAPSSTSSASWSSGSAGANLGDNPFKFPLANGFPNVQNPSSALTQIEDAAHGTLPNGAPPPSINPDDLLSQRLIAFNELWEVAFFTELLANVTNNVAGYQFQDQNQRQSVITALTAIQAQEELHALNANGVLNHFNAGPIQPCTYVAPVSDFPSAIALAAKFTDVVLGTLGDVIVKLGLNGDAKLARGVVGVVGQEGEQNGYYRELLGEIPSAAPFLTASTREFAFSALNQDFVVAGSCPNINTINLPIFGVLNLETPTVAAQDQQLTFSFDAAGQYSKWTSWQGLNLVYINQQNTPVAIPISGAQVSGSQVTFSANFPFTENLMFGLTIAVVTNGAGPFADVDAVAAATLFGPALIEVQ
ncbi:hypothetical protein EDD37DRAFT_382702 [Exophiala viscosa]|uniref:uncharacterized protein n=1 Tax=Exophiala viscosa TaxID=2486360 RepID=UPI002191EAC2|nr:hypothetical protein EDD37DRAFT_382702 [Exophiala viscosa]